MVDHLMQMMNVKSLQIVYQDYNTISKLIHIISIGSTMYGMSFPKMKLKKINLVHKKKTFKMPILNKYLISKLKQSKKISRKLIYIHLI